MSSGADEWVLVVVISLLMDMRVSNARQSQEWDASAYRGKAAIVQFPASVKYGKSPSKRAKGDLGPIAYTVFYTAVGILVLGYFLYLNQTTISSMISPPQEESETAE